MLTESAANPPWVVPQAVLRAEPVRAVLDTNVVLDLLVFEDPSAEPIRAAVEGGRMRLFASRECLDELRRVLAYPAFGVPHRDQELAFAWYAGRVNLVDADSTAPAGLPRCRDRDDQKFLQVAWSVRAQLLITKIGRAHV